MLLRTPAFPGQREMFGHDGRKGRRKNRFVEPHRLRDLLAMRGRATSRLRVAVLSGECGKYIKEVRASQAMARRREIVRIVEGCL